MMKVLFLTILMAHCAFLYGESAYNYNFVKKPMTMVEARRNCQMWGGDLVTIQNAAQNAYILSEMKRRQMDKVWIGFSDVDKEGKFKWVDSYTPSRYTNWDRNEPNNFGNEDCTEIMIKRKGKWNDQSCSDKIPSVCYKVSFESQFIFVATPMTKVDAAANCKKFGSELATVQNVAQNAYILNEMKIRKFSSAWIGFNDIKGENKFTWVDSKTCSKYTNWRKGEPNNAGNEDCTEIRVDWGGKWNDKSCTIKLPSVCFKPAPLIRSQFKFVRTPMSKFDAVKNCRKLGGELATVQNAAQNAYIYNEMKKRNIPLGVLIGLNDLKGEGKFEWVDSNSCSNYLNWHRGEPNNLGKEDCTVIVKSWGGKWNDLSCNLKRPSLCYKTTGFTQQQDAVDEEPEFNNDEEPEIDADEEQQESDDKPKIKDD